MSTNDNDYANIFRYAENIFLGPLPTSDLFDRIITQQTSDNLYLQANSNVASYKEDILHQNPLSSYIESQNLESIYQILEEKGIFSLDSSEEGNKQFSALLCYLKSL